MELVTVGTGTVAPSATRTSACHWVSRARLKILLDCGPGALHRLAQFGLPWPEVTHVVLSHFHPDHWAELPMLVYALKYTTVPPRQEPLVILGPPGVVRLVKTLAEGYGEWLLDPGFPIGILDVRDREPFPLDGDVSLETCRVPHTPESVAIGLTGPEGRLVYTGDTGPSPELARWAAGCDLLLAECSLPEAMAIDSHLTPLRAGELARGAGASRLEGLPGVQEVIQVTRPYKQVSREWQPDSTVVQLGGGVTIGGTDVAVIAGPCSVETERQILEAARQVKEAGAVILRGGAWKPRTSPYAFQGLGRPGLKLLAKAREETGLLICTEAMDPDGIGYVAEVADIIQIGARNMQNFSLLKIAGRAQKPVLLKRGMSATIEELLLSAEYLLAEGNHDVILCERGIRGFDTATRNVFDLTAIPVVHKLSHLPIIADPSHGTGLRDKVIPMARAAVAAGADGIMVEVHPNPEQALSDGAQTLYPDQFAQLMREVRVIADVIGRRVAEPAAVGA